MLLCTVGVGLKVSFARVRLCDSNVERSLHVSYHPSWLILVLS